MTLNNIPISRSAVESVIDCNPLIVVPATSLVDAIALMSQVRSTCRLRKFSQQNATSQPEARASCVLVIEGTQLVGLLTEQDLVKLVASGRNLKGVKVADVMKQQLITLKKSEFRDIFSIFNLFSQHRIRHLPVLTDSNQLLGIATPESARQGWQPADLLNLRRVAEVMATQVIQAQPTVSVLSLAQLMVEYQVSCIVITEKITDRTARPLGIVTERDIVQFQALELDFGKLQAQDVMSSPLFCLHPEDSLQTAYEQMLSGRVQRLIVSNSQGEFLGIITQTRDRKSVV